MAVLEADSAVVRCHVGNAPDSLHRPHKPADFRVSFLLICRWASESGDMTCDTKTTDSGHTVVSVTSAVLAGEVLFGNFSGITVSWFRLGLSLGYFTKLYAAVYFSYIEKLYLITMK